MVAEVDLQDASMPPTSKMPTRASGQTLIWTPKTCKPKCLCIRTFLTTTNPGTYSKVNANAGNTVLQIACNPQIFEEERRALVLQKEAVGARKYEL